jgi:hypothetical protein
VTEGDARSHASIIVLKTAPKRESESINIIKFLLYEGVEYVKLMVGCEK